MRIAMESQSVCRRVSRAAESLCTSQIVTVVTSSAAGAAPATALTIAEAAESTDLASTATTPPAAPGYAVHVYCIKVKVYINVTSN